MAAAILTAAGAIPLGHPAIAGADPNNGGGPGGEWDIGAYDFCVSHHPSFSTAEMLDHLRWCCESTGGVWGWGDKGCHAPPGQTMGQPQGPVPPQVGPVPVQQPPPPPDPTSPVDPGTIG